MFDFNFFIIIVVIFFFFVSRDSSINYAFVLYGVVVTVAIELTLSHHRCKNIYISLSLL